MIPLLGMTCVAWTAYEIVRLAQRVRRPVLGAEAAGSDPSTSRPRRRRFAAWDDRGRPIDVEDLGQT